MATVSHRLEYIATRALSGIARLLGPRGSALAARLLGRIAYHLVASRRRIAQNNLRDTIAADWPAEKVDAVVRGVFANIAQTLFEIARFPRIGPERTARLVAPRDMAVFDEVSQSESGAIWVTAHFGNWELLGYWASFKGYSIDYLVGRQHNRLIDDLLNDMRRSMGVGVIPVDDALRGVLKALRDGRFVAIASDQHAAAGSLVMDFLGKRASIARGPAMFAVKANCPVVPVLVRRERYDRHVVMIGDPIYPPQSGDRDTDVQAVTRAWCDYFEQAIRQYPEQWAWTHRRWKV